MTLNVTLATEHRIYQSSDYMITISNPYEVISTSTTKVVQFQYEEAVGFISYTGIARWPRRDSRDTANRVAAWLEGKTDLTLNSLAELIQAEANPFIRRIAASGSSAFHTFTIAGFENGNPAVILVSNYEKADGRTLPERSSDLTISRKDLHNGAFVVVTGQRAAVHKDRKRQLERLGDLDNSSPGQIREVMSRINLLASRSLWRNPSVSESCSVFSIDAAGNGVHELTPGSRIDPIAIHNGHILPSLKEMSELIGLDASTLSLGGATFATSRPGGAPPPACEPSIVDGNSDYTLVDISVPGMAESNPLTIGRQDGNLAIAGTCSPPQNRGHYQYWIWTESAGHGFLPVEVENANAAFFLEEESLIVVGTVDGKQEVLRLNGDQILHFDKRDRFDASCHGVNELGQVGGSICGTSAQDRGQGSSRPTIWDSNGQIIDILDGDRLQGADWGYVQAMHGTNALVIAYAEHDVLLMNWPIGSDPEVVSHRGGRIVGVGFSGDSIIGFANDSNGLPVAMLLSPTEAWSRLGSEPGWLPLAIANDGSIGGRVSQSGFLTPSIFTHGETISLPHYRYHHSEVGHISSSGEILGKATADHGVHALLWRDS
ncbi:MAG: hypothetical protein L0H63_11950 [Nitrococcus sp.]|nr:hypothetical protein [Nitrococcus sp.]